jgi:hypothetical protein
MTYQRNFFISGVILTALSFMLLASSCATSNDCKEDGYTHYYKMGRYYGSTPNRKSTLLQEDKRRKDFCSNNYYRHSIEIKPLKLEPLKPIKIKPFSRKACPNRRY